MFSTLLLTHALPLLASSKPDMKEQVTDQGAFVDIMMSIPRFFLLLTIVALFRSSLLNTMLVIGLASWMGTARLVRGQFLSLREKEFIMAFNLLGDGLRDALDPRLRGRQGLRESTRRGKIVVWTKLAGVAGGKQ